MTIQTKTKHEYVYRYVSLVGLVYGLNARETEVAAEMCYRYLLLEGARAKFSSKKKREEYDPMLELRKPETLKLVYTKLGMDIVVFRGYVKKLKMKKVFVDGTLNKEFLPMENKSTITVWLKTQ